MKTSVWARGILLVLGVALTAQAAEIAEDLTGDAWVAAHAQAAADDFAGWKATGKEPESFSGHAMRGERGDLIERVLTGDRLAESEIRADLPAVACAVTICNLTPLVSEGAGQLPSCETVWRRITKDRFEVWTPNLGKLFDAGGKQVALAKVHRSDGWGREWYGAFLPDGRWVTTDLGERDDRLTMFSAKGKRMWSIKGATLIPQNTDASYDSLPLIAWARAAQDGKSWIVAVGSEFGRGWVKVTPDGTWKMISSPWTECLPQQLGPRGMYTAKLCMSDDGKLSINRNEPGHGVGVGWPTYDFPSGKSVMIPNGDRFGILADAWAVFIASFTTMQQATPEERQQERVWLLDAKGNFQRWVKGRKVGASLASGGLWVRLTDDTCVRVDKGFAVGAHWTFATKDKKPLVPVEIHDDIGLGVFLLGEQLAVGTWKAKE
jgi:hypothetical protein